MVRRSGSSYGQDNTDRKEPLVDTTVRTTLRAEGFACPSCVTKIEKHVGALDGVANVTVHFASSRIDIEHNPDVARVDDLVAAVRKAGYVAAPSAF
jgi:copper chaperone